MPKQQPIYDANGEMQLMARLWSRDIRDDPRNFVRYIYPWDQPNTLLHGVKGPRNWQDKLLLDVADYYRDATNHHMAHKQFPPMFKAAVASGRGIGKSATFAWLAHWMVSTRLGSSAWVAANSETQLQTKTFAEIARWVAMSGNAHWWEIQATSIKPAEWFAQAVLRDRGIESAYWAIQGQLWSEENPDSFAGAHNVMGEMALFDEASGIPASIWPVQQGVFTEPTVDRYWLAFSNPRRNEGAFYECFNKNRDAWRHYQIDARTVEGIPPDAFDAIIKEDGPDSYKARVEVYGQFPDFSTNQFIGKDAVRAAMVREVYPDPGSPLVFGVDVARFGEDHSVIAVRKGRDARSIPWKRFKGLDLMRLSEEVADMAGKLNPQAIFVDGNGVGGGVVDILKSWGYRVIDVQAGERARDSDKYDRKAVEMWALMKQWLPTGSIPNDENLERDLISREYGFHPTTNQLQLETVAKMKDRGLASPDDASALALTFSQPVARMDVDHSREGRSRSRQARDVDYNVLG